MATTKIWPIHGNLSCVIDYISNPEKTVGDDEIYKLLHYVSNEKKTVGEDAGSKEKVMFVTTLNIVGDPAEAMRDTEKRFGKTGGVTIYHAYQSFKPGEVTPEICHEIGVKLARKMWGSRYQVVVTSHLDHAHLHNHFAICPVSFIEGKKYNENIGEYRKMREESDRLCREYCVRVSNGLYDGRQQLVSATFKPRHGVSRSVELRELAEFERKFERAVHNGLYVPGAKRQVVDPYYGEMPLATFIEDHYFPRVEDKLSQNTIRFYRAVCNQFLIPSYGKLRLCDITHHHLQDFIDFLAYRTKRRDGSSRKGLSPASVKRYATVFCSVITEACRYGFLEENPLRHDSITYPKIGQARLEVYTEDEVKAFCGALSEEPPMTRLLLLTPLLLGLRRAEIVALKWEDIDEERQSLSVNKSAYKIKSHRQGLKSPKSLHGNRTVFYSDTYAKALAAWKDEQEKIIVKQGTKWQEQGYIFTTDTGNMISIYTSTRICSEFQKRHGLRHLKLHGLRHTCGSLLVAMGTDPETVREILGHDSVKTTDIYLHPYDKAKKKAADILDAAMEEIR